MLVSASHSPSSARTDLAGVFSSIAETPSTIPLSVSGVLPRYLSGTLLRNGPGAFELDHADGSSTPVRHWFDGTSMLHGFTIDGAAGTVSYRSRVTAQGLVRAAKAAPSAAKWNGGITFGLQDPCKGALAKVFSLFTSASVDPETGTTPMNVGVTIQRIPGLGLTSRTDGNFMFSFDKNTLEIEEFLNWKAVTMKETMDQRDERKISGVMTASHGVIDDVSREYFNYSYAFGREPITYEVFRVGSSGCAERLAEIHDRAAYLHSLAASQRYVILIVYPQFLSGPRLLYEKSIVGAMSFNASAHTHFHVIERETKRVVGMYTAPACFAFHVVNAFDDSAGDLQVDLCMYSGGDIVHQLTVENLRTKPASFFDTSPVCRVTLPSPGDGRAVDGRVARVREMNFASIELPRINDTYNMRPYKYVYGVSLGETADGSNDEPPFSHLSKVNLDAGSSMVYTQPRTFFSEPIFVASPDADAGDEDAGCVVSVAYNAGNDKSYLLVLNAKTFMEVARAECVGKVAAGFHGAFEQ
jgi:carotenoid cleavage dioxygenase-like enzyme